MIPAELSKNGKSHVVPLSEYALCLLSTVPRWPNCDFVFTTTGRSPIRSFSKSIRHVHAQSKTSDWRFHDLRHTAASGMARLGIAPHVVEKVLNHLSGIISGITAVYLRYGFDAEKREALDAWGKWLEEMATPTSLPT